MPQRHMLKQFGILGNQRLITFVSRLKLATVKTFGKSYQHIQQNLLDNLIDRNIGLGQLLYRRKGKYTYPRGYQCLKAHITRLMVHHAFDSCTQRLWSKEIMANVFFVLEIKNTGKATLYKIDMFQIVSRLKDNLPFLVFFGFCDRIKEDFQILVNLIFLF